MHWKARQREIDRLTVTYGLANPNKLPDYSVDRKTAPCSDSIPGNGRRRHEMKPPPGILVGTPHKQGPMVVTKAELPWAGGKKS